MGEDQVTVNELLDELDDTFAKAAKVPLMGGRRAIDVDEAMQILSEIRSALPSELSQARAIVDDRSKILSAAKREAETMVRVAEEKSRSMVSQQEVIKEAQSKAVEILSQAQIKAREIKKAANDYLEDLMKRTDDSLTETLTELRKTRANIRQSQKPQ